MAQRGRRGARATEDSQYTIVDKAVRDPTARRTHSPSLCESLLLRSLEDQADGSSEE